MKMPCPSWVGRTLQSIRIRRSATGCDSSSARFACAFLAAIAFASAAEGAEPHKESYDRGLLWRVSKPGVAPSYLFGTIHVADPRVLALPAPVKRAFEGSREFVTELATTEAVARRFFDAARFTDGETLESLVGRDDFEKIAASLTARGIPAELIPGIKPWAAMLELTVPSRGTGSDQGAAILDRQLFAAARARRLVIGEVDQLEEQIFLFDEMPMESQVALLRNALRNYASLEETTRQAIDAWLKRDLADLWRINAALSDGQAGLAPHQAIIDKRLLYDRNIVMAYRMGPALRRGRAFVAVGALHLYGERGLLKLLADEGYRIRRVY